MSGAVQKSEFLMYFINSLFFSRCATSATVAIIFSPNCRRIVGLLDIQTANGVSIGLQGLAAIAAAAVLQRRAPAAITLAWPAHSGRGPSTFATELVLDHPSFSATFDLLETQAAESSGHVAELK